MNHLTEGQELELCKLYVEQNFNQSQLRKKFNLSQNIHVRDILIKNNIKVRKCSDYKLKFNLEKRKEILNEYLNNKSLRKTAKIYACDISVIKNILYEFDVWDQIKEEKDNKKKYNLVKILEMYDNKINIRKIAHTLGISQLTVTKILEKERGYVKNYNRSASKIFNQSQQTEIVKAYLNKDSITKISNTLNVSRTAIEKILRDYKIKIRSYREDSTKYLVDENYFDINNLNDPNKYIVLGLLYTDGYNHTEKNSRYISIALSAEDKNIIEFIQKELKYNGPIKYDNKKNTFALTIKNYKISKDLESLGCVQNKSLILKYPHWIQDKYFKYFLYGVFLGDGGCHLSKTCGAYICGSKDFIIPLSEKCKDLYDIKFAISKHKNINNVNFTEAYLLSAYEILKFFSIIMENTDIFMKRKANVYVKVFNKIKHNYPLDDVFIEKSIKIFEKSNFLSIIK